MTNFQVDLVQLRDTAKAWSTASDDLSTAVTKAQELHDCNKEITWSVFQAVWDAQVSAAQFLHDRLNEGSTEAKSISNVLNHIATVYENHDQGWASQISNNGGGN
ncbi:type VII secretion target [Nocardia sp. NPDC005998]|uniref:type VII secretion target n=1 Tax=Nocardia sp. NPDC005998 TaxID=3156894 RepID=UPI0033BD3D89